MNEANPTPGGYSVQEPESSLRDVAYVLFRHKFVLCAFFLVVVGAALLYGLTAPSIYQSDSRLLIKVGRESLTGDPAMQSAGNLGVSLNRTNEVNSEVSILSSKTLMENVVNKMGVDRFQRPPALFDIGKVTGFLFGWLSKPAPVPGDPEAVARHRDAVLRSKIVKALMSSLEVKVEKETDIINLSFQNENPALAHETLDKLVMEYKERHIEVHKPTVGPDFFGGKTEAVQTLLLQKEKDLQAFRTRHNIAGLDTQKTLLLTQVDKLRGDLTEAGVAAKASGARVAQLEKDLASRPKTIELSRTEGIPDVSVGELKAKLADLKLREAQMEVRYPDTSRNLIDVRDQIRALDAILKGQQDSRTQVTIGVDVNRQNLEQTLETERTLLLATEARKTALAEELAARQAELTALTSQEAALLQMDREVRLLQQEYQDYRANQRRSEISSALDEDKISNVSIVQRATVPFLPVKPHRFLILALAIAFGAFGGVVLAFVLEFLDHTVRTNEDVARRLGLPVLATISEKEFQKARR